MHKDSLFRAGYDGLAPADRETLLLSLAETAPSFQFLRFERFGMRTDTAVFLNGGREFVFVPGDTVVLGWAGFAAGMDEDTRRDMLESLEEWGVTDLDAFLNESMSPVRTTTVRPMLVERRVNAIGWRRVAWGDRELEPFRDEMERFSSMPECGELTFHKRIRFCRRGDGVVVELYEPVSLTDFIARVHDSGFSLPTEDEWEYLCGGGSRTLFRWGDSFDYSMKLHHFEACSPKDAPYTLEEPNQFGLSIAYDPYRMEVVEGSEHFIKGGDGGCNICGGMGIAVGYLPVSTYFRRECPEENESEFRGDIGGDYTFYRSIVRL